MTTLAFGIIFLVTITSACVVAFSPKLIYSAFALIGTFMGIAGAFVLLNADFLGLAQLIVYAGGILILTIFAVMLTARIEDVAHTNPVVNKKIVVPVIALMIFLLWQVVSTSAWLVADVKAPASTIDGLGQLLLTQYLMPFEVISILLLAAMIGAAIITRRYVKS